MEFGTAEEQDLKEEEDDKDAEETDHAYGT